MTNPLKQQDFPFLIESEPVSQQEEIMADAMRSYEESIAYILRDEELTKAVAVELNKMSKQEDDSSFLSPLAFAGFFSDEPSGDWFGAKGFHMDNMNLASDRKKVDRALLSALFSTESSRNAA